MTAGLDDVESLTRECARLSAERGGGHAAVELMATASVRHRRLHTGELGWTATASCRPSRQPHRFVTGRGDTALAALRQLAAKLRATPIPEESP